MPGRSQSPLMDRILVPVDFSVPVAVPGAAVEGDQTGLGQGLDVVHHRRLAQVAAGDREGRADARPARLAFQRFDQGGFLAADIGAGAEVDLDVEVEALAEDVFAQQAGPAPWASADSSGSSR
jgi:hypothetical protein